ncbi:hypothetical protein BTR25_04425 [Bacillus sp. MRMR6]|nr:hypothetical protein BTR25_04425 [Bacillus sp. MRMR6]
MDYQQLQQRRQHCLSKMQKAVAKYHHYQNMLQQTESLLAQQPFLQVNPATQINPHLNVSPFTQVNPHLNVSPLTQVNPHVEVNPITQINPKLFSDIQVSPTTQTYLNLDPDLYLKLK